jgi:protein-tyrosine-phosphatase
MAAAFARILWPMCRIKSAGIRVRSQDLGAADLAISTMAGFEIDIRDHRPTHINEVVVDDYEFVLALDNDVRRALRTRGVAERRSLTLSSRTHMVTSLAPISTAPAI